MPSETTQQTLTVEEPTTPEPRPQSDPTPPEHPTESREPAPQDADAPATAFVQLGDWVLYQTPADPAPALVTRIYTPPAPYLPPALDLTIFHAGEEIGDPANHVP